MRYSLYSLVIFLLALSVTPARKDISSSFSNGRFRLSSTYKSQKTFLRNNNGVVMWVLDEYIGRQSTFLSPDGDLLLLVGDYQMSTRLSTGAYQKTGQNPVYFRLFKTGQKLQTIRHKDIFNKSIRALVDQYKLPEIGGGWIGMGHLIINMKTLKNAIDWKNRKLQLELVDGSAKTLPF